MERILFSRVPVWVLVLLILIALPTAIGFGYAVVQRAQGQERFGVLGTTAYNIATVPDTIQTLMKSKEPMQASFNGRFRFPGRSGWVRSESAARPDGYVLLSRFDPNRHRSVVELVDLTSLETVFTWEPAFESLFEDGAGTALYPNVPFHANKVRITHPLIFDNGDILVKDMYAPMGRFDACGQEKWSLHKVFHHATEFDADGNIWSPGDMQPVSVPRFPRGYYDDSIVQVSPDGKVLFERSLTDLLMNNGYAYLVLGMSGDWGIDDILHLNDIQPVLTDGTYWKKGDVFLSFRFRSTVMLYRPSTDEILWLKTGPWSMQHDVDIVGDGRIAIFDNRAQRRHYGPVVPDTNRILEYDFASDEVTEYHPESFAEQEIATVAEGLSDRLPDGGMLVEETGWGRIEIFDAAGRLALDYVNGGIDGKPYALGWSRYLPRDRGDAVLAAARSQTCSRP